MANQGSEAITNEQIMSEYRCSPRGTIMSLLWTNSLALVIIHTETAS